MQPGVKERQVPERGGISLCIILQYKNQVYNTDALLFMLSHVVKTVKTQMGRLDSNSSGGRGGGRGKGRRVELNRIYFISSKRKGDGAQIRQSVTSRT